MSRRVVVRSMLGRQSMRLPGRLRGDGAGKCGCDNGLYSRKGRAHQLGRRISAQSDGQGAARGVFARAGVDGSVAGESSGCSKRLANGSLGVAVA